MPFNAEFKQLCCYIEPNYNNDVKILSLCAVAFVISVHVHFTVIRQQKLIILSITSLHPIICHISVCYIDVLHLFSVHR